MSHLSQKSFRNAYDAFTEAIRLSPLKVVQLHASLHPAARS
jgi:cytochrome c-type biogenesis protein CcmH/NrfG